MVSSAGWRRGWDSNPRYACAYSGFRDRHVQPLRHLSGRAHFTSALTRRLYDLEIPHVGLQNRRNIHAAIGALIVLHDRNQRAPDREPRSVERVNELRLAFLVAEARLHAPRLKSLEIAARRDLAIRVLPGKPDLDVVGFCRREAGVTGAQRDHAVRQLEFFQDRLGMSPQLLVCLVRFRGMDDLHQLDLVELGVADHAARVLAGGAGLRAKTRRVAGGLQRPLFERPGLGAHEIGYRVILGRAEMTGPGLRL